jgi:hypothetical protein
VAACVRLKWTVRDRHPVIPVVTRPTAMLGKLFKRTVRQTGWSANAYLTDQTLVIHACSRTYNNRGWYNQPVFKVSPSSPPREIGERLRAALVASVWDSRKDDSQLQPHPVVREAGYETWKELEANSRHVITSTDQRTISLIPCRAAKRGFAGLDDQTINIRWEASDDELGESVLAAFARSTSKSG